MKQVKHVGEALFDIEEMCSQLIVSPFSDKTKMAIPLKKLLYLIAHCIDEQKIQ